MSVGRVLANSCTPPNTHHRQITLQNINLFLNVDHDEDVTDINMESDGVWCHYDSTTDFNDFVTFNLVICPAYSKGNVRQQFIIQCE